MEQARDQLETLIDKWLAEEVKGEEKVCHTEKLKIYAPTCKGKCEWAVNQLVDDVNKVLMGTTTYDKATGCWWSNEKKKVECEPVRVIEVAHSCQTGQQLTDIMAAIVKYGKQAEQHSISILNNRFFITETPELSKAFEALAEKQAKPAT